jgi:hypothetical protein
MMVVMSISSLLVKHGERPSRQSIGGTRARRGVPAWLMQRRVRDLSCGDTRIFLELEVRRVDCRRCGRVKRQQLDFLADNPLYTKRFAYFVGRRCRGATIKDVAEELKLDWHTVKTLDQQYTEAQLERAGRPGPQVIGVDEIAIRAQEDFSLDAKLKIGNDIWTPETAGARFYEQVLSKKPTTVPGGLAERLMGSGPNRVSMGRLWGRASLFGISRRCPIYGALPRPMALRAKAMRKCARRSGRNSRSTSTIRLCALGRSSRTVRRSVGLLSAGRSTLR